MALVIDEYPDPLSCALLTYLFQFQVLMVDTRSCIADFRTNSFVGTEGEPRPYLELLCTDR